MPNQGRKQEAPVSHVTVAVNGRNYRMSCAAGAEPRVMELAAMVDAHVARLRGNATTVQDERLYLMAAIVLADELLRAKEELAAPHEAPVMFKREVARLEAAAEQAPPRRARTASE